MYIIAPLNSPLSNGLKLVGRILIMAATVVSGLGVWSYQQQCGQTREIERTTAFHNELYAIVETYAYIHQLGEGRAADARQKLNLALQHQIESLDMDIISTDEDTRAWAKGIVALIASDKRRHPAYYAIPGAVTPDDGLKAGRPATEDHDSAPRIHTN